jgi:hypothetical protein
MRVWTGLNWLKVRSRRRFLSTWQWTSSAIEGGKCFESLEYYQLANKGSVLCGTLVIKARRN